jgi:molybdenum-dependent DNA-binding transcriptional regulator ModE
MEKQNITLAVPKDILLKVKLLAVRRGTSISGLLTETLERMVEQEEAYAHAQRRHLRCLAEADDLGTEGRITTPRNELHERA